MSFEIEIDRAATKYNLPSALIFAMVTVESGDNPWAWNPEPKYRWFWNVKFNRPFRQLIPGEIHSETPPNDFPCLAGDRDQEWWGQQASWGLMQTMGAVARESGFIGKYLTELCDPVVSLEYGCRFMKQLVKRHGGTNSALSAYNTGSPLHPPGSAGYLYVNKVRRLAPELDL